MSAVSDAPKRRIRRPCNGIYYTPAELAERMRVDRNRVVRWIMAGDLFALNLAPAGAKIPRWLIPADSVLVLEQKLGNCPRPTPASRRPKASKEGGSRRYGTVSHT